jgi:hypothetical protein
MKQRWIAHGSRCDPLSAFLDDESGQLTCLSGDVIKHSTIALLLKKPTTPVCQSLDGDPWECAYKKIAIHSAILHPLQEQAT